MNIMYITVRLEFWPLGAMQAIREGLTKYVKARAQRGMYICTMYCTLFKMLIGAQMIV